MILQTFNRWIELIQYQILVSILKMRATSFITLSVSLILKKNRDVRYVGR
jgi:hypothetical protein